MCVVRLGYLPARALDLGAQRANPARGWKARTLFQFVGHTSGTQPVAQADYTAGRVARNVVLERCRRMPCDPIAPVVQMVEHLPCKQGVARSNRGRGHQCRAPIAQRSERSPYKRLTRVQPPLGVPKLLCSGRVVRHQAVSRAGARPPLVRSQPAQPRTGRQNGLATGPSSRGLRVRIPSGSPFLHPPLTVDGGSSYDWKDSRSNSNSPAGLRPHCFCRWGAVPPPVARADRGARVQRGA